MTLTLFEILTDEELGRLKKLGLTRNVRVKDLTLQELEELKEVFRPTGYPPKKMSIMDVIVQLSRRKAI